MAGDHHRASVRAKEFGVMVISDDMCTDDVITWDIDNTFLWSWREIGPATRRYKSFAIASRICISFSKVKLSKIALSAEKKEAFSFIARMRLA